jgi:hypothetical protein
LADVKVAIEVAKKQVSTIIFVVVILLAAAIGVLYQVPCAVAESEPETLTMPQEWLNYTITTIDGSLWAVVDGLYPMHLSPETVTLPMVYPIPPNTTDVHIKLDGVELAWSNYTDMYPTARHYTVIGDWQMVYCIVEPSETDFVLQIHYQHPIQTINESCTFLYDLNIIEYLSPSSPMSTAHFQIQLPPSQTMNVFTTAEWKPVNYTSTQNGVSKMVTFDIVSVYGESLAGDIVFVLPDSTVPEFPSWVFMSVFATGGLVAGAFYAKHRFSQENKSGKSGADTRIWSW